MLLSHLYSRRNFAPVHPPRGAGDQSVPCVRGGRGNDELRHRCRNSLRWRPATGVPVSYVRREFVAAGGLMSYGPDKAAHYHPSSL
jgi:hypothetical protein